MEGWLENRLDSSRWEIGLFFKVLHASAESFFFLGSQYALSAFKCFACSSYSLQCIPTPILPQSVNEAVYNCTLYIAQTDTYK